MVLTIDYKNGFTIKEKVWNAGITEEGRLQYSLKKNPTSLNTIVQLRMVNIKSFHVEEEKYS